MGKITLKQPFWRTALSYLFDFEIESVESDINGTLRVNYSRGEYQLCTENAIYSHGSRYKNFLLAFKQLKINTLHIENVLILGFGMGSIPYMLEKNFNQIYHYTAVDIDETVFYLANEYVLPTLTAPIECICTDALIFLAQNTQLFDLIVVDIFLDDVIPSDFLETDFLEMAKDSLSPDGWLLFNALAYHKSDRIESNRFFEHTFKKVFEHGFKLSVANNFIFCGRGDGLDLSD